MSSALGQVCNGPCGSCEHPTSVRVLNCLYWPVSLPSCMDEASWRKTKSALSVPQLNRSHVTADLASLITTLNKVMHVEYEGLASVVAFAGPVAPHKGSSHPLVTRTSCCHGFGAVGGQVHRPCSTLHDSQRTRAAAVYSQAASAAGRRGRRAVRRAAAAPWSRPRHSG